MHFAFLLSAASHCSYEAVTPTAGGCRVITSLSGTIMRVLEEEIRLRVGSIEYQVLVPEIVRRALQMRVGEEVTLATLEYIDGNPTRGKLVPRLVGFLSEPELEFFELLCTVDGVGVKKALKALVRSVRDIADMIEKQDLKMLASLPGLKGATGEKVVATLRRKVARFALMVERGRPALTAVAEPNVVDDAFQALVQVGHSEADARRLLDRVAAQGQKFKSVEEILLAVYQQQ
jgi:Holliday junction DNA helicase RuvA